MEEQTVKKRGWVKNAAIVFLSVMLVLTFFSNTIRNHSLPEVATATVTSGNINARIRGTGTVTAGESYEVVLKQTRKVETVYVKVGDTVQAGDVLFLLSDTDSSELKQAVDKLESLRLSYQRMLLNLTQADYARENREIQKTRAALDKAKEEMANNVVSKDELTNAAQLIREGERALKEIEKAKAVEDENVAKLETDVSTLEGKLSTLNEQIDTLSKTLDEEDNQLHDLKRGNTDSSRQLASATAELNRAKEDYAALRITYGKDYDSLEKKAAAIVASTDAEDILIQMAALISSTSTEEGRFATDAEKAAYQNLKPVIDRMSKYEAEVAKWQALVDGQATVQQQIATLQKSIDEHEEQLSDLSYEARNLQRSLDNAKASLDYSKGQQQFVAEQYTAQAEAIDNFKEAENDLKTKQQAYETAASQAETLQSSLEDQLFSLAEQKKNDDKAAALQNLDIQEAKRGIAEQEAVVESLKTEAVGKEVTAGVSGLVSAVNVTAGRDAQAETNLATIEVVDRGYSLRIPVTVEQSRKVRIGDTAEVANYYWGPEIKATLTQILTDPQNPNTNKILLFNLTGNVSSGQNLTLSIGERSSNYDAIIPSSAIRSDTNGSFVLVVTAKNTPLGNRYTATRVDVKVLAQDDTQTAVSGLSWGDFVITTSSKPIEAGMLVKMVENP